jgi:hypothetical protein
MYGDLRDPVVNLGGIHPVVGLFSVVPTTNASLRPIIDQNIDYAV